MKCCEKWKKQAKSFPEIWNYCVQCGGKLEREYCECDIPRERIAYNNEGSFIKCVDCYKPIKPKREYCECKGRYGYMSVGNFTECSDCHKPIKPKKELPEKIKTDKKDFMEIYEIHSKINEILDYLGGDV